MKINYFILFYLLTWHVSAYSQATSNCSFLSVISKMNHQFSGNLNSFGNTIFYIDLFKDSVSVPGLGTIYTQDSTSLFVHEWDIASQSGRLIKLPIDGKVAFKGAIYRDSLKNYYTICAFRDTVMLGNKQFVSQGGTDILVFKVDSNNHVVWEKHYGSVENDIPSVFSTGNGSKKVQFFMVFFKSVSIDTINIISNKKHLIFIEYSSNGNVFIMKNFKSLSSDLGPKSVINDINGNIFFHFSFLMSGTLNLDLGGYILNVPASYYDNEATGANCIVKYDSSGTFQWVRHYSTNKHGTAAYGTYLLADSYGSVYVYGSFTATYLSRLKIQGGGLFNANSTSDIFLFKYDKDGNFQWFRSTMAGSSQTDRSICISPQDEIYEAHTFGIHSGFDGHYLNGRGGSDFIITKFDTAGQVKWISHIGGTSSDEPYDMVVADTSLYVLGKSFSTPCEFNQVLHTTQAPGHMFLAKMDGFVPLASTNPNSVWSYEEGQGVMYPNPCQEYINLELSGKQPSHTATLSDMSGRVLLQESIPAGASHFRMDVRALPAGIYTLRVGHTVQKICKE